MKSIIKVWSLFLVFGLMTVKELSAKAEPAFNISERNTLIIELNDWKSSDLTLEILDDEWNQLFTEAIVKGESTLKEYNLNKLKIGEYILVLYGDEGRTIHPFSVGFDSIKLDKPESDLMIKPIVEIKKNHIEFDYLALGEDVKVTIFGQRGVIYSEYISGEKNISKKINTRNLGRGNYIIMLDSKSQNYSRGFRK